MINNYKSLLLFTSSIFILINTLNAQNKPSKTEIKGIIKSKAGEALAGSSVWLCTPKDTLKTSTDENGRFLIKGIKLLEANLLVRSLGYESITKTISLAENKTSDIGVINLTGIINTLKEVVIYGKTGIKYKKDTVEYHAGDYKVPKYATVEDLMKKMEGLQVDRDGNVIYNGKKMEQVNLNGVTYFGGKEIANAIRELPADIVNKIQLVDDVGEESRITGMINLKPKKVLNIVTKADKSAGKLFDIQSQSNFQDRYTGNGGLRKIDGEEQSGAKAEFMKAPIAGPNQAGATGGAIKNGRGDLFYNNKLGKKVTLQGNYNYAFSNNHVIGNTTSQEFFDGKELNTQKDRENTSKEKSHTGLATLTYLNKEDNKTIEYLSVNSSVRYSPSENQFVSNIIQKGAVNQDQSIRNSSNTNPLNYNISTSYSRRINKKGNNIFLSLELLGDERSNNETNLSTFRFYTDKPKDSILNRLIKTRNNSHSYNSYLNYKLVIGKSSTLGFIGNFNTNISDNKQDIFNINTPENQQLIDSLSRPFDFRNTDIPIGINYQFNTNKLGLTTSIQGFYTNMHANVYSKGNNINRNTFNLTPDVKLYYRPNNIFQLIFYYAGKVSQPTIDQLQEVPIVSDPANIIIGNPGLKPIYTHILSAQISSTLPTSNINISTAINTNLVSNKAAQNLILIVDPTAGTYRETRYANLSGDYTFEANYSIYKAFPNNKYTINYSGNINKSNTLSLIDNIKNTTRNQTIGQSLSLGTTPSTWFESNLGVRYSRTTNRFERDLLNYILTDNWAFDLNTRFNYPKQYAFINITFIKNFISGINANTENNPFLINASISKRFPKHQFAAGFQVFDLLKQNSPLNRQITSVGIIESRSNPNSRYFMATASWAPQMWTPGKKAKANKIRKNDGSYID